MKPTQKVSDAPAALAVQPDSPPPTHLFDALLALYKARVYERYGHEIGSGGESAESTHRNAIDSPAADR